MKKQIFLGLIVCSSATLLAQLPPPVPAAGVATNTVAGSISQFTYGPDGRVQGVVVAPNTLISLPPDWAMQVELLAKPGDPLRASGFLSPALSGMQILQPQTITVAGRNLNLAEPSQPVPYAGSGVIRTLNYGPQGEVNGFVLQNGILALTPPIGTSDISVVRPGARISLSGFAHIVPSGRTVVEVQSITANGQTIAMSAMPPGGPGRGQGPGRGPGPGMGPGPGLDPNVAPPPPPPPPGQTPPPPPAPDLG
jgi:hypothetical protein